MSDSRSTGDDDRPFAATLPSDDPALAPTVAGNMSSPRAPIGGPTATDGLTSEHPGRYRRESELGRGGMGRVVLAYDEHLGREIAMKELLAHAAQGSDAQISVGTVARFLREARITGQLEHPGIVPVHELGRRADGTIYYTMKRIRGRSLASVLRDASSPGDRLKLIGAFSDVCEAIAYAHSHGVVHRDLKPDNIMVGEFGETLVVDWGLAKKRGEREVVSTGERPRVSGAETSGEAAQTIDGHAIGTPAYMSPEQARGDLEVIDERSDVWGLGAILFEILTGRAPYEGSAMEVVRRLREESAPRVRTVAPSAPPELAAIADRALMHDPSSRYPGARELALEIAAWQEGGSVRAYEYSALELARRFVNRHRAASIAVIAISISIVTATSLVTRSWLAEQSARRAAEARYTEARAERENAVESERAGQSALAEALLERAERALADGDPGAAAIYAAGALARDPASVAPTTHLALDGPSERRARERRVRARSTYLDAEDARRFVLERRIETTGASAALAPGGRLLAMPTSGGVAILDLVSGERREVAIAGVSSVLAFVGDERIATGGAAPGVYAIDTGERAFALPEGSSWVAAAGGRIAIASSDGEIRVLDGASGGEIDRWTSAHRGVVRVAWSPEGSQLAISGRNLARIDVQAFPRTAVPATSIALGAWSRSAIFSPDGAALAVTMNAPEIRVVELGPPASERALHGRGWTNALAWISDHTLVVAEASDRLVVRRMAGGAEKETLHVASSSGHRLLASAERIVHIPVAGPGAASRGSVFRRVARSAPRDARTLDSAIATFVVDAPRQRIVVATAGAIVSVELRRHRLGPPIELGRIPDEAGHVVDLAVAGGDGAIAAVTTLGAVVLIEPDGAPRLALPPSAGASATLLGVAFDRSGEVIYAGTPGDGRIRTYRRSRASEGEPLTGHTRDVLGLTLSPDGQRLASASEDGTVRVWNIATGVGMPRVLDDLEGLASHCAFSPDGERLACGDGRGNLHVARFDGRGGARAVHHPHERWINRVAWTSDGRRIVTASDDGTVRVLVGDGARVERIVPAGGTAIRGEIAGDGTDLIVHRGRVLVRIPIGGQTSDDPAQLLREAESRAGVRLEGLELVPITE